MRDIVSSIERGIEFLCNSQLDSGQFPTKRWKRGSNEFHYVKDVFSTATVLYSLKSVSQIISDKDFSDMIERALKFIENESENGFWRFFGKNSDIHFDLDTTSCCVLALKVWKTDFNYQPERIIRYKRKDGSFFTWVEDIGAPYKRKINDIDWCVNANILYMLSSFGVDIPDLEKFLIDIVKRRFFEIRSLYYESGLAFSYFFTRIYSDGGRRNLKPYVLIIRDYLIRKEWRNLNPLDLALMGLSLINCGEKPNFDMINRIIDAQREDGGWDAFPFFTEGLYSLFQIVYGSEAITTAFAVDFLSRFLIFYD